MKKLFWLRSRGPNEIIYVLLFLEPISVYYFKFTIFGYYFCLLFSVTIFGTYFCLLFWVTIFVYYLCLLF